MPLGCNWLTDINVKTDIFISHYLFWKTNIVSRTCGEYAQISISCNDFLTLYIKIRYLLSLRTYHVFFYDYLLNFPLSICLVLLTLASKRFYSIPYQSHFIYKICIFVSPKFYTSIFENLVIIIIVLCNFTSAMRKVCLILVLLSLFLPTLILLSVQCS